VDLDPRLLQTFVLLAVAAAALLGAGQLRPWVVSHPRWILAGLVVADTALLLWATTPFVPDGVDESQFLADAHRLRGADLPVAWIRTPLPILFVALTPGWPALPGILAKQLAALLAYALARPALGPGFALVAALLTSTDSVLAGNTCQVLSEPFGAAALAGFAIAAAGRSGTALFGTAALGFLSRWQLLWLLPVAALLEARRKGLLRAAAGMAAAAGVVVAAVAVTGVDPWRAFQQERTRGITVLERLQYYLAPHTGLGLGIAAMLLAGTGSWWLLRARPRDPRLFACAALFLVHVGGTVTIGVITRRFLAPSVPLGCVLAAAGALALARRWPALSRRWPAGVVLALLAALTAIPVHAPASRRHKLASPQAALVAGREQVLSALGGQALFTDVDVLAVTAILGRRCHAVLSPRATHPQGVPLDFEGQIPAIDREELVAGSYYLTLDPADRPPIWRGGQLALVRW
jgi:hypothetical protein